MKVAVCDSVRLATLPSEVVTFIRFLPSERAEGEGGDGFGVGEMLRSVAEIY